jgi:hypothetical protein
MGGHRRRDDPSAGWPVGQHSPITPRGEAEQLDRFLFGLSRQHGWRGVAARVMAAAALLAMVALIVAGIAYCVR